MKRIDKMTNYERIKSMNKEEMAHMLNEMQNGEIDTAATFCTMCADATKCEECVRWWLGIDSVTHPQGLNYWEGRREENEITEDRKDL